jgi:monomeric sarcosine oxidase
VQRYTHIIIGAGAIGSAAAFWLSREKSNKVLVIEQFDLVNSLNSSGDHSRIIRHAYHSTAYTSLTRSMFEAWSEVEDLSGLKLYTKTGGLDLAPIGSPGESDINGYKAALDAVNIPYETLTADDVRHRYPQWNITDDIFGLYQEDGGLIDIRKTVSAHTSLAMSNGVEFLPQTKVNGIALHKGSVTVRTSQGGFLTDNLVVAAASWLGELMPDLGLNFQLTLSQEQVSYFSSPHLSEFTPEKFPIWIYHDHEVLYGFPVYGEAGVKLARDMRGRFITSDERVYEGDAQEAQLLHGFLKKHLPRAAGPALFNKTCVYDMAPDREFVLDTLPDHPNVAVFNGAGHAGKFASLIGKILSQMLTSGGTRYPIEAFSLTREALVDPAYQPVFRLAS